MIKQALLPNSLVRRFSVIMIFFTLIGVLFVALISFYEHYVDARKEAASLAQDRALTILDAIETASTMESLNRFILSVAAQPSVQAIYILNREDIILFSSTRALKGAGAAALGSQVHERIDLTMREFQGSVYWDDNESRTIYTVPIDPINAALPNSEKLKGGVLLVVLDPALMISEARREAAFDAGWAGGVLMVIVLFLSAILHRWVGKPIVALSRHAAEATDPQTASSPPMSLPVGEIQTLTNAISELSRARASLAAEKNRLADIANTIPGAVYEYRHYPDDTGAFTYFSDGVRSLIEAVGDADFRASDVESLANHLWSLVVPEDIPKLERATFNANTPSVSDWKAEFRIQTKSGVKWLGGHALPVEDSLPGQLFRGVLLDITRQKNLEKQLTEAATHDPLTGALNRAGLEVHFERTLARVQRDGGVVSVALIDIDRFKYVNDTYGHNVGDSILVQLVHLLKSRLRKADSFARWGGEEFLVLLPDTYLEGARQIAEELRLAIEQTIFEHHEKLTISVGVAASDPEDSPKDLVRRADNHLYLAKNTGRNQVVSETLESASISPGLRD